MADFVSMHFNVSRGAAYAHDSCHPIGLVLWLADGHLIDLSALHTIGTPQTLVFLYLVLLCGMLAA